MLVQTKVGTAQPSEGFAIQSREYSVDSPALVFDVLCNRMYNKPLDTMVQEYLANARDAHREVGVEELIPVQVTMPTDEEPYLIIRDFGPGLTEQRIDEVFIRLGASTKSMDDVMTGGFGLGAKIGWAYNDSFTVISVVGGVKSTYLAYRDEQGIGRMDTLSVDTTDERNGVAIKVMIKEQHRSKLYKIISKVTYFWKLAPVAVNTEEPFNHCEDMENRVNDLYYGSVFFSTGGVQAIVDGIPYSVDSNNVAILDRLRLSSNKTLCLFFDVGEIEVAINREGIKYSPKTVQNITHTIQSVMDSNAASVTAACQQRTYLGKLKALRSCYTRIGAPATTVTMLQAFVALRFQYGNQNGVVNLINVRGCRSLSVRMSHNGKVRDPINHYTDAPSGTASTDYEGAVLRDFSSNSILLQVNENGKCVSHSYICMLNKSASVPASVSETIAAYKANFRTLVERHRGSTDVIFTDNWSAYTFLVNEMGLTPIYDLPETHYKRSNSGVDRTCNFTEVDVKDVTDRNRTKKLGAMDLENDMWCLFKERNDVLERFKFVSYTMPGFCRRDCWYVTAEQVAVIKDIGVKHYTEVYNEEQSRIVPNLYGVITTEIDKIGTDTGFAKDIIESGSFYRGSIYNALLANIHLFDPSHLFYRYMVALARKNAFESSGHPVDKAHSKFYSYVDAIKKIENRKIRSYQGIMNLKTKVFLDQRNLERELNEAYPLLGYLTRDFYTLNSGKNASYNAVVDHVIQYLLGKC